MKLFILHEKSASGDCFVVASEDEYTALDSIKNSPEFPYVKEKFTVGNIPKGWELSSYHVDEAKYIGP